LLARLDCDIEGMITRLVFEFLVQTEKPRWVYSSPDLKDQSGKKLSYNVGHYEFQICIKNTTWVEDDL
jgi:hypothetical protein